MAIDEAHLCSSDSQRGRLAQAIWDSRDVELALAVSALGREPAWLVAHPKTRVIGWSRRDLRALDGRVLFPERAVEYVDFQFSGSEIEFADRLAEALSVLESGSPMSALIRQNLLRRLASSLYTAGQSLRRYVSTSVEGPAAEVDLPDEWPSPELSLPAAEEIGNLLSREVCTNLLELLEQIDQDGKWATCVKVLTALNPKKRSVVVFTDFADTADYVAQLSADNWQTYVVTAGQPPEDRWKTIEDAQRLPGVLILTSAATVGVNLAFTDRAVHYDVPRNPQLLLQRFGSLERLGSRFAVVHHHMLVDELSIGIATDLERKARELERALDGIQT